MFSGFSVFSMCPWCQPVNLALHLRPLRPFAAFAVFFVSLQGTGSRNPSARAKEGLEAGEYEDPRMVSMNDDPYMTLRSAVSKSFESIHEIGASAKFVLLEF